MIISFLVTFLFFVMCYKYLTKDILNPVYTIFIFIFSYSFFLMDRTETHPSFISLLVFIFSIILLYFPCMVSSLFIKQSQVVSYGDKLRNFEFSKIQILAIIIGWFISFSIYYYIEFIQSGVLCPMCSMINSDIKSVSIEKIHRFGKDSQLQLIASQAIIFSSMLLVVSFKEKNRIKKIFYLSMVIAPPLFGLLKTSKSDVLFPCILYFVISYYYFGYARKLKIKHAIYALSILILFLVMTNIRVESLGGLYSNLISYNNKDDVFSLEPILYGYTAGSLDNLFLYLGYYHDPFVNYNFGYSFFRPLLTLTFSSHDIDTVISNIYIPNLGPGATVGTFMRTLAVEGGIFLLLFGSLIYGIIIAIVYFKMIVNHKIYLVFIYGLLFIPWFMLFFQNLFANLNLYFSIIIILSIFSIPSKRQRFL